MRIPVNKVKEVLTVLLNENQRKTIVDPSYLIYKAAIEPPCNLRPLYSSRVSAGFPSPASDYQEPPLDLNRHLISHPESTFFVKATGESMINANIHDGDLLIVDKSLSPQHGKIVIAVVNGELTVKRLNKENNKLFLMAENPRFKPILITEEMNLEILGIVTGVIHSF